MERAGQATFGRGTGVESQQRTGADEDQAGMSAELIEYYRDFPVEEHLGRIARLRDALRSEGLDAALVTYEPNIRWLVGYHTMLPLKAMPMAVVVPSDPAGRTVFLCASDATGSDLAVVDEVRFWDDSPGPPFTGNAETSDVLAAVLNDLELANARIGMELGPQMRVDLAQQDILRMREALPGLAIADCAEILWRLRSIKSDREIQKLRTAAEITLEGYRHGLEAARDGMTERELANIIRARWFELGATGPGYLFVSATWRSVRNVHVGPVDIPLQRGEIFNLDGGCSVDGYLADIFREACIGQPANDEDVRLVNAIIEAKDNAIAVMRPGQTCGRVWEVGAETLQARGFGHLLGDTSLGHGIGLEMHEWLTLSRGSERPLEENMVFCVEPWTMDYTDWSKGRNVEDMVRVTGDGTELLSPGLNELVVLPG